MMIEERQLDGGVALLVDFENLVLDADGGRREVDCGALMALAARYGPLCGANAYADWRTRTMRRYPEDLYGAGLEFVPVLGRYRGRVLKNAVDVRMAVDAIDLVHTMPSVDVYVVATGDGDFVHLVQALQRHGKKVVGVAPQEVASADLVALCDRFVYYESIAWRAGTRPRVAERGGALGAVVRNGRAAGHAVRRILGFRGALPSSLARDEGAGPPDGENGSDAASVSPPGADGAPRAAGWGWIECVRELLESGAVAVNADGGWLHRIGDDAFVVEPDGFEAWAEREKIAVKTARNRVRRLMRHRSSRRPGGGVGDRFYAVLGDGRRVQGMVFPGELLWDGAEPEEGPARLV